MKKKDHNKECENRVGNPAKSAKRRHSFHRGVFAASSLDKLPPEPDDQAGAADAEQDAGDPAAAHAQQVADHAADDAADQAEDHVQQNVVRFAMHDPVGRVAAQTADHEFHDELDKHGNATFLIL